MKIFKDKNLKEEIIDKTFDFGVVPAGKSKTFTFYVLNDSNAFLKELKFIVDHNELEILDSPKELKAQTFGELIIEWQPSITLKEGLKTNLHISGKEHWG